MENMELAKVLQVAEYAKKNRRDYVVNSEAMGAHSDMENHLKISIPEVGAFGLTEFAHGQMASKLGIPQTYYDKMRFLESSLLAQNVETWLHRPEFKKTKNKDGTTTRTTMESKNRMIRILDNKIRAVVSSRFKCLDNYDVMILALDELKNHQCGIKQSMVTETNLYLKAVTPEIHGEVNQGDVVQQGIIIRNSEVGAGALRIEPMIWRLVCSNGVIGSHALKVIHAGSDKKEGDIWKSQELHQKESELTWLKARDIIRATFNGTFMEEFLEQAKNAAQVKFQNPVQAVDNISEAFKISDKQKENVLNAFLAEGDPTIWGLTNAITTTAKNQEKIAEQVRIEEVGYKVMTEVPKRIRKYDIDLSEGVSR